MPQSLNQQYDHVHKDFEINVSTSFFLSFFNVALCTSCTLYMVTPIFDVHCVWSHQSVMCLFGLGGGGWGCEDCVKLFTTQWLMTWSTKIKTKLMKNPLKTILLHQNEYKITCSVQHVVHVFFQYITTHTHTHTHTHTIKVVESFVQNTDSFSQKRLNKDTQLYTHKLTHNQTCENKWFIQASIWSLVQDEMNNAQIQTRKKQTLLWTVPVPRDANVYRIPSRFSIKIWGWPTTSALEGSEKKQSNLFRRKETN